jgi:GNAT superfamily N-acetyltransferase
LSLDIKFRQFNSQNDLESQRELFLDAFPEAKGTSAESLEHYRWKFQSYPDQPTSSEYVATYQDKIVGYYAAIPYRYKFEGEEYKVAMVCDVMTHSSMRGKGIFTKLGAFALKQMENEGYALSLGYPIRKEVIPGHLKVGWRLAGDLPLYLKVFKTNALLKNTKFKIFIPLLNFIVRFFSLIFKPKDRSHYKSELLKLDKFLMDKESLAFFEKINSQNKSTLIKTREFLSWRYSAPDVDYDIIVIKDSSNFIQGVAFSRATVLKDIPTLAILDLVVLEDSKEVVSMIFKEAEKLLFSKNLEMISFMMTPVKYLKFNLFYLGFIKSPFKFQLISRVLSKSGEKLSGILANDFNPMWVDSDDL